MPRLSSSRIAQCSTPALLPLRFRRPIEAKRLVSLGCSLYDGLFIARSSGTLDRENARNNETKASSSNFDLEWFPWSLVRGRISAPVDRRLHDRKQLHTRNKSAQPHSLFNIEAVSCRTKQWNQDKFIWYFDVEWFPWSLVRARRISAPVDRRLHDRQQPQTPHKPAQPPFSVGSKLSKSCQNFLNLLVREERTLTSERSVSQHAFVWDAIFV